MEEASELEVFQNYYLKSVEHRNQHKCGGYPFSFGPFLNGLVEDSNFKNVLEIGTAIGYSAFCLAHKNDTNVTTIDLNELHGQLATENWKKLGVDSRVSFLCGKSQEVLQKLNRRFELIFFDGFNPNPEEVDNFDRLLIRSGVLFTTNLNLGENSKLYLDRLTDLGYSTYRDDDNGFSSKEEDLLESTVKLWQSRDWELSNRSKS